MTRYTYKVYAGLPCPLGKFVNRGGEIAFTIPPDESAEAFARLKAAGAVPLARYSNPVFAANEFARTPFVPLLQKADFADVVPLPRDLETTIADNINRATGIGPVEGTGVYVNTDAQITYAIYLVDHNRQNSSPAARWPLPSEPRAIPGRRHHRTPESVGCLRNPG